MSFGKENVTESAELHESVKTADKSDALYALIEAIHAGETRNDVSYMEQALKRAVGTWTENYNKPVLKDHRELADNQLGRVIKAEFIDTVTRPHTLLTAKITNPLAIDKINKGEYLTVSIGSEAKKALCSICGVDVIHEWSKCPHWRGEYYDEEGGRTTKEKGGRKCVYEIHELSHDEVSFVSTPADADAKVVKTATSLDKLKEGNVTKNDILNEIKAVEDSDKESSLKAKEVTDSETDVTVSFFTSTFDSLTTDLIFVLNSFSIYSSTEVSLLEYSLIAFSLSKIRFVRIPASTVRSTIDWRNLLTSSASLFKDCFKAISFSLQKLSIDAEMRSNSTICIFLNSTCSVKLLLVSVQA